MRGCLTFLMTVAVVAAVVAWFLPPPVADTVLSQSLSVVFGGPAHVDVRTDFPPSLLTLHADRVDVTASDARLAGGTVRASNVSLRLADVDLLGRTAAAVDGTLDGVTIDATDLGAVSLVRVTLAGPSRAIDATATVAASEARRILAAAISSGSGRAASSVDLLPPASSRVTLGGVALTARLEVVDGDLIARPDQPGVGPITVLTSSSVAPFALTSVSVENGELVLAGRVTGTALGF